MAHPGNNIRIPLSPDEAVVLLGRVKPTSDMPRQGAHPTKAKRSKATRTARTKPQNP
jgi:hypothetical protein